ncbi:MAG: hypothetical protein ACHRXM_35750 [Isosphaerales bacterium]
MRKGELMVVRRFVTLAVSVCLVLAVGITRVDQLLAQDELKKAPQAPPKAETATKPTPKPAATKKDQPTKPAETPKPEAAQPAELPLPPIPPAVQAKIDAARRAVAEAIVAAQDAGLVETSIDPPPILDILINGRATDTRTLKNTTAKKPYKVSPEVFGAWFTGYGKLEGVNYVDDLRIINPSDGLKQWYDQRARFLEQYIQEIRKAKGPAPAPKKDAAKPAEPKKTDGAKKAEDTPKKAAVPTKK